MILTTFRSIVLVCIVLALSSCGTLISIQSPTNNASYKETDTVQFEVFLSGCADKGTFTANLDNQDIGAAFTFAGNTGTAPQRSASTLGFNRHTLSVEVSRQRLRGIGSLGCAFRVAHDSRASRFSVKEPSILPTASPATQTTTWGQTVSYQIEVTGVDAFSGTVMLSATVPTGATGLTALLNPSTMTLSPSAPSMISTLTITSIEGETSLNQQHHIQIDAVAGTKSEQVTVALTLKRRDGDFTHGQFRRTTAASLPSCTVSAVVPSGSQCVRFDTPQGSTQCINFDPLAGYIMTSPCRVSVVSMPTPAGFEPPLGFWNIGFPSSVSNTAIPDQVHVGNYVWHEVWLSPDQSLAVWIMSDISGSFQDTHVASLLNNLTKQTAPPEPFTPGTVGGTLQVDNVRVLNEQVTIEYRDGGGNSQSRSITVP